MAFPPGTKCVVVHVPAALKTWHLGQIVTMGPDLASVVRGCGGYRYFGQFQKTDVRNSGARAVHPYLYYGIDWLRALDEGIDARDHETVNEYIKGSSQRVLQFLGVRR